MRKLKIIVAFVLVIMTFSIASVAFAYDDYCPESEDGYHEFDYVHMKGKHPHEGTLECFYCGEKIKCKAMYNSDCEVCRVELCEKGVHCYIANINYIDEYGYDGYGECYCGKRKNFLYDKNDIEVSPGIVYTFDKYATIKHPHKIYNEIPNKNSVPLSQKITGLCGVCDLEDEYNRTVRFYTVNQILCDKNTSKGISNTIYEYVEQDNQNSYSYAGEECYFSSSGMHDFSHYIKEGTHPHAGYRQCICGEKDFYDISFYMECEKCRRQYCEKGLHYYLAEVNYTDLFSGYAKCYCGNKKYFSSYNGGKNMYEPYPGIMELIDRNREIYLEIKHPHREYDPYSKEFYFKEEYVGNIGNCVVCELLTQYRENAHIYNITGTIKTESQSNHDHDYNIESDEYKYFDDGSSEEDEDFYEWLELAYEILKE